MDRPALGVLTPRSGTEPTVYKYVLAEDIGIQLLEAVNAQIHKFGRVVNAYHACKINTTTQPLIHANVLLAQIGMELIAFLVQVGEYGIH